MHRRRLNPKRSSRCLAVLVFCCAGAAFGQPTAMSVDDAAAEPSPQAAERMSALAQRMAGVAPGSDPAAAPETPAVVVAPIESTPLGRAPANRGNAFNQGVLNEDGESAADAPPANGFGGSTLTTLAALGVVIALIFGVRFLLAKATKQPMVASSSAVEVLSRTSVAARSHVLLVRVGPRVLVVGDSPGGLRTLDTVTDEQEVAAMLQAVESAKPQSLANGFSSLMGKFNRQYDADAEADGLDPLTAPPIDRFEAGLDRAEAPIDRARHGLSALAGRLRVRGNKPGASA